MSRNYHPTFNEWLYQQRERADEIGQLSRDMLDPHQCVKMWIYSLINRQKHQRLRTTAVRAFVEYKVAQAATRGAK